MHNEYSNKSEQMRHHIQQCQSSGQRISDYCAEHGVSKATYYYWHKKLNTSSASGEFIALPATHTNSRVEVILPNGVQIHFDQLIPSAYLKELVCSI